MALSPERRKQMDMTLGRTTQPAVGKLTPERRRQMDIVLGRTTQLTTKPVGTQIQGAVKTDNYLGDVARNIIPSGVSLVKDIGSALLHPVETAKGLGKTAVGLYQLTTPGEQEYEAYPKAIGEFYKQRYGGKENIKESFRQDPLGVATDVASVLSLAGAGLKGTSKVATLAGKAGTAEKLSKAGAVAGKTAEIIDPIMATTKAVGKINSFAKEVPIVGGVFKDIRPSLASASEKTITAGLGKTKALEGALGKIRSTGESLISFWDRNNLWERTPDVAQDAIDAVKQAYGGAVKSGEDVKVLDVLNAYDDLRKTYEGQALRGSDTANEIISRIDDRKQRFLNTIQSTGELKGQLKQSVKNPLRVSSKEVLEQKRTLGTDIPEAKYRYNVPLTPKQAADIELEDVLRLQLEKASPGTRKLGVQESALIDLSKTFRDKGLREAGKQTINFSKLGTSGVGAFLGGLPGAISGYVLESVVNSPTGTKILAKTFDKLSKVELDWLNKTIKKGYEIGRNISSVDKAQNDTFRRK